MKMPEPSQNFKTTLRIIEQENTMSEKLFVTILEHVFKQLEWRSRGISIDREKLSYIGYADDIILVLEDLMEAK